MSTVADQVYEIILVYCRGKTIDDVRKANSLTDLELDSVAVVGILGDIEEQLQVEIDDVPNAQVTLAEFVKMVEDKVAAKG